MRVRYLNTVLFFFIAFLPLFSCQKEGPVDPVLIVSPGEIAFEPEGGEATVTIESNEEWSVNNSAPSWLQINQTKGVSGSTTLNLAINMNETGASRNGVLSVNATNGQSKRVVVKQGAWLFPSYNTSPKAPDATGMSSTAVELAAKMTMGWNIGNTLEAIGGENAWGNPDISKEYVEAVKSKGFNAIRLPCAWDQYSDQATAKIGQEWMDRVKEVVGYCVDNDMYVLLNIHWDGGWLEKNCTPEKKDLVNAKQKAFWEQIATAMRDFDEHLMFASANEPNVHDAVQMEVLHSYHQTFVNAVRSTGGRNSYRILVIQGPDTNIEKSNDLMNMPTDEIEGRMMAEVHFYSPAQFCILLDGDASWGKMFYYWGAGHHSSIEPDRNATWGEEDEVDKSFALAKTKFVDKGIPVILGEYGAYRRDNREHVPQDLETHNNAVDHWITYVTKQAIANGVIPFWWDTGGSLDRANFTVKDQRTIDALIEGSK
nr:cellulase family glycosylhydrolase [Sunxiuqinia sp.]